MKRNMSVRQRWCMLASVTTVASPCRHARYHRHQRRTFASQTIPPIKGCHDLFPPVAAHYTAIESSFVHTLARFNCHEIRTPIIEQRALFVRSMSESDIVTKELFAFDDHGTTTVLRPEGTAGIVRALITRGLTNTHAHESLRYYYAGPMFRRERPQRGRYRQFAQFGCEFIGIDSVSQDIECIDAAHQSLASIGLSFPITRLHVNTLGDSESRARYYEALTQWTRLRAPLLSADSSDRLARGNVLRILDSKDSRDQSLIAGKLGQKDRELLFQHLKSLSVSDIDSEINQSAPLLRDYLNDSSRLRFEMLASGLRSLGIDYVLDDYLVRGLDYYNHTAFEFKTHALHTHTSTNTSTSNDSYASQSTVLAGGRYDGLIETLGGPVIPAVGWAAGIDRLVLLHQSLNKVVETKPSVIAVIAVNDSSSPSLSSVQLSALSLASSLRSHGFTVIHFIDKPKVAKQFSAASKSSAVACVVVGENENARNVVQVKRMDTAEQREITRDSLVEHLRQLLSESSK